MVISSLPLAKFYSRDCSAIMLTSLNSIIGRSQAMISLNALCTIVLEGQFIVSWLLRLFQVGFLWIPIQWVLSSPVLSPTVNVFTCRRQLVIIMNEELLLCTSSSLQLVQVSRQSHFLRREVFGLALVLGFRLMPFVKHHISIHAQIWLIIGIFSQHGFLAARLQILLPSCGCDDFCNVRR